MGLDYFFTSEPKPVLEIVRKSDRMRFPDSPDTGKVAYYFESLDFPVPQRALTSFLGEFESIEMKDNRFHNHPGIEFLYVISGKLELHTGGKYTSYLRVTPSISIPRCRIVIAGLGQSVPRLWW